MGEIKAGWGKILLSKIPGGEILIRLQGSYDSLFKIDHGIVAIETDSFPAGDGGPRFERRAPAGPME